MATCPNCGGFLHAQHRCYGRWRRRARTASWMLVGAAAGIAASFLMADRPTLALSATCAVLGAVLVTATRKFAIF
jgi:hypothetical protein